ncbi:MAG: hypothetical protein J0I34_22530 [Pseudonocardia sp.]|uniref:hypothetical protein n=1 Tax=Pseudonocardia sp. TaxID=60912 RepID=UPI001AD120F8|nr:hypothetical protein [Pseudonocardia sp.]MBN9111547.1 hypothetical protein [Pseudonocardia sp.]
MNANGPVQPGVPPRAAGGDGPAPSPDDTLAALVRDRAVVVAALLDAGSGMLLTSRSRDGAPEDLETVCAGQADVIRAALDAARVSIGGPEPTEVVVAHGDRLHQLLRTVHDPLGDRLVLSLLVEGPPRALRRVRRRLGRIDATALVPLPHRGTPPPAPAAPAPVGGDLFTPAHPTAQGPWWAGAGVPAEPQAPATWAAQPPAPATSRPPAPVPGAPGGFSAEVIDSAIEATVRIAARTPAADATPAPANPVPPALPATGAADGGPAGQPDPDAEPVTTALPVVETKATTPAPPGPLPVTLNLGSNPAALPARSAASAAPAPAPAVTPSATAAPAVPATPVAMPTVPARPAAETPPAAPAPAPAAPPPPVGSVPAALPARTPAAPAERPAPTGRAAGWSTASVLGHGAGPGGAPTATDVVAAPDRAGTDDSLSGAALFAGVVPADPPPPVDDPPPPLSWEAGPAPAQPAAPVDGSEPHPWFGGGKHSRPGSSGPGSSGPSTAQPGPGRHTTPAAAAAPQPPAAHDRPVPPPRAAETPVDRVVAAALQGGATNGGTPPSSAGWLFEPAPRARTDVGAAPQPPDSAPAGPGEGQDGGNRVDPGR